MGQGEYFLIIIFLAVFIDLPLQKTAHVRACLCCQQAWAKCQVGGQRFILRKRTREEESLGEGPTRRTWVRCPWDIGSEGGADIGPLLKGVRSALEEQTWLIRQMWATHTSVELELQLLRQGMEYAFDHVFGVPDDERRGERGGEWEEAQGEEEECGALEEAREGEETMG